MKLSIKGAEIKEVTTWNIDTIKDLLADAREQFRLRGSEADAKECERLYGLQKEMEKMGGRDGSNINTGFNVQKANKNI